MANTKLTLSVPTDFVKASKKYVLKKHTSISKMFYELMSKQLNEDKEFEKSLGATESGRYPVTPEVETLTGIISTRYTDKELNNMKYDYLSEKYGLK